MTTETPSPLRDIATFDELFAMPYFEFLACLGEFTLHPGGLGATVELLRSAGLRNQDRVLEIGSGTGSTTQALLASGLDVSVVEPSERMLRATLRNCARQSRRRPKYYHCGAEDLSRLPRRSYDLALYECVFGFISDPRRAIRECARVLAGGGARVCVIDLHYVSEPPERVRAGLKEIFGRELAFLRERDWHDLFADFQSSHWEALDVPMPAAPSPAEVKRLLSNSGMLEQLPGTGDDRFEQISTRWAAWNDVFIENKKHMRVHRAVWTVRTA